MGFEKATGLKEIIPSPQSAIVVTPRRKLHCTSSPVHQEEVEVVDAKVLEGRIEAYLDLVAVERVPELARDPKVVAVHARLANRISDRVLICSDGKLVLYSARAALAFCSILTAVSPGRVNVAEASLERLLNGRSSLFLFQLPGAEANLGDLGPVGQSPGLDGRTASRNGSVHAGRGGVYARESRGL